MNLLDRLIRKRAGNETDQEIYASRWVWYHTILCFLLFNTNLLLLAILVVMILK